MALRDDFLRMMAEETAEQAVHGAVESELRTAIDAGASPKDAAKRSLKGVFGPTGPVMALARTLPGWTFPLLGTAVSALLKKSTFVDRLLPGDDRAGVKEARWLLKNVGPHAVLGAFTGYRSAAAQIDAEFDKARSDANVAPAAAIRPFDRVVAYDDGTNKGAVPAKLDAAGNPELSPDGVPIGNGAAFRLAKDAWDRAEFARVQSAPRGQNQGRVVPAAVRPFPARVISLSEAIAQGYLDTAAPADLSDLRAMLRAAQQRPTSWGAQLSPDARDFLLALSVTRARQDPIGQSLAEDFFKDLPGKGDVALIEHMATTYHGRIQPDGSLPQDVYDAAISHIDSFLGGELTLTNRALRLGSRIWRNRGTMGPVMRGIINGIGWTVIHAAIFQIGLFLLMVAGVGIGYFCPPSWGSALTVGLCSVVLTAMLFQLPIIQGVLKVPARFMGASEDWLSDVGRRMTFALIPIYIVAVGLTPLIEVSYFARFFILMLVCIQIGRGMGAKVAKQFAWSDLLTFRGAKHGWLVTFGILGIDWMIRQAWHIATGSWIASVATTVWPHFNNQWGAMFFLFVLVFGGSLVLLRWFYRKVDIAPNGARFITHQRHGGMAFLAFVFAVAVAVTIPWFAKTHHEYDPFAVKPAAAATMTPSPAPVAPAATPHKPAAATAGHAHSDALNCGALSEEGKAAAGCP